MYGDCGHEFYILSLITHPEAKVLSDVGLWDKMLSKGGSWSNLCQSKGPWHEKVWEPVFLKQGNFHKHYRTEWMLILADALSSKSLHQCLGKQWRYSFGPMKLNHFSVCVCVYVHVCVHACACIRACVCDSGKVVVKFGETKGVRMHLSVCMCVILTVSPDCVNLRNISRPCSGSCCYGDVWKKATNIFKQIRDYLLKKNLFSMLQSPPPCSQSTEQIISLVGWEEQTQESIK